MTNEHPGGATATPGRRGDRRASTTRHNDSVRVSPEGCGTRLASSATCARHVGKRSSRRHLDSAF